MVMVIVEGEIVMVTVEGWDSDGDYGGGAMRKLMVVIAGR